MTELTIFCPTCLRYLGATEGCPFCGWVRSSAERIPEPGMPLWRLPILASPQGEPLFAGEVIYCADLAGRLYAVKASSGEGLSQYESGGTLRSTLLARGPRYTPSPVPACCWQ